MHMLIFVVATIYTYKKGTQLAKYLVPLMHIQAFFFHQPLHQLHTSSRHSIMKQSEAQLHISTIQTTYTQMQSGRQQITPFQSHRR